VFSLFFLKSYSALVVKISPQTIEVCAGDSLNLDATIVSGSPYTFRWISPVGSFSDTSSRKTKGVFSRSGNLVLETSDGVDIYRDTVLIKVNFKSVLRMKDASVCRTADTLWLADELVLIPSNINLGTQKWECLNCGNNQWDSIFKDFYSGSPIDKFYLDLGKGFKFQNSSFESIKVALTFTNAYGCSVTDSVNIGVEALPTVNITTMDTTICGTTVILDVEAEYEHTNEINWFPLAGGNLDKTKGPLVKFTASRDTSKDTTHFQLYVQTAPGFVCPYTDDLFTLSICAGTVGIAIEKSKAAHIYPNPNKGIFTIENSELFEIKTFDVEGRQVELKRVGENLFCLKPGIYLMKLKEQSSGVYSWERIAICD